MQLLDAVNLIMPKLGERAVTSLEVKHPTLAVLLPIFEQVQKELLLRGWWFNKYEYTAYPDINSEITLGTTALMFVPKDEGVAIVRGRRLYNPTTLTYKFTGPVTGTLTEFVEFDALPETAANYVMYSALVDAYSTDIGVGQDIGLWQTKAGSSWSELLTEHLKQRRHNTRKTRAWAKLTNALQG